MSEHFKATKIAENVYWVGAIDWVTRNFHGYSTSRGTTYNAYLILDEKVTLIDTVKAPFKEEFIARLSSVINLEDIDYIISNHSEPDHSGLLPDIIELTKPEKVFASKMGVKALNNHYQNIQNNLVAVNDGETLNIGKHNLTFYEARMLHWPDSMITYLDGENILFSNDIFGMHLASYERFDDELEDFIVDFEAAKYFANIILPFSNFVIKMMEKLDSLNLDIKLVATDHGPIWRKNINKILTCYKEWPLQKPTEKAVIVYETMWGSTEKMANAYAEGLSSRGINTEVMPINGSHRSDIATEVFLAGALLVGSPVLNTNIFPSVVDVLTYVKGLRPKNLIGTTFGSYGWSSSPLDELNNILTKQLGVEQIGEPVLSNYVPDHKLLNTCYDHGVMIAEKLKEICQ